MPSLFIGASTVETSRKKAVMNEGNNLPKILIINFGGPTAQD